MDAQLAASREPVVVSLATLEARFILPGRVPAAMVEWFARLPTTTEARQDHYLVHPRLDHLSVKIRGLALLELKSEQDAARPLGVRGIGTLGVKSCEKWSFQLASSPAGSLDGSRWKAVGKTRRISRFSAQGTPLEPERAVVEARTGCAVELTAVEVDGEDWWTIALEATGSGGRALDALGATAETLFSTPLPAQVHLTSSKTRSYSQWLRSRHGPASCRSPARLSVARTAGSRRRAR